MEEEIHHKPHRQWHPSGVLENLKGKDIRFKILLVILGVVFALILLAVMLKNDQDLIRRALAPLPPIPETLGELSATSTQAVPWRKAIALTKEKVNGPFPDLALMKLNLDPENIQAVKSFQLIFYSDLHLAVVSIVADSTPLETPDAIRVYALKPSIQHLVDPLMVQELIETKGRSSAVELLKRERTKALARVKNR